MTYRELYQQLQGLTQEQLDMDVTVLTEEDMEYHGGFLTIEEDGDVLDPGHPVIMY